MYVVIHIHVYVYMYVGAVLYCDCSPCLENRLALHTLHRFPPCSLDNPGLLAGRNARPESGLRFFGQGTWVGFQTTATQMEWGIGRS